MALAAGVLVSIGCAASHPPPAPGPHPGRFVARAHESAAADWAGRYAGAGEVFSAESGTWRSLSGVLVDIRRTVPGRIRAVGTVADTVCWDLDIPIAASTPGVLNGRCRNGPTDPWFTYSFSLIGPNITGVIERYPLGAEPIPETGTDQWMIDVRRRPAGP